PEAADPTAPKLDLPPEDEATRLGDAVAGRGGDEFEAGLKQLTDAEGPAYTKALLRVVGRTDGDRRRQARDALAERLTRMSAKTLRAMMVFNDAELRRGAVLAAAMQEDPKTDYVPDLIARVAEDEEDLVVRAARAGLKALTGSDKDFGPADGASKAERKAAADAWRQFWAGKKK
ncbi:MAG: hypothetical protein K2X87_31435, partial [Gemmataceae bacterium]|nr:hypothetical protein [Gemmataceae bacterium]